MSSYSTSKLCKLNVYILFAVLQYPIVETIALKQALANAWGQLGEESAVEPLLQLREDAEARVRWQAIAALKHFSFAD